MIPATIQRTLCCDPLYSFTADAIDILLSASLLTVYSVPFQSVEAAEGDGAAARPDDVHAAFVDALLIVSISVHKGLDDDAEKVFRPAFEAAALANILQVECQSIGQVVNEFFIGE